MLDRDVFPYDPELKPRPELIHKRMRYELTSERFVQVLSDGSRCSVPTGYLTDGASIPRFFWRFIGSPYSDPYIYAAIVHDFRYEVHGHPWDLRYMDGDKQQLLIVAEKGKEATREEIDKDFYEGLKSCGMGRMKSKLMYWAVRFGGGGNWEKK